MNQCLHGSMDAESAWRVATLNSKINSNSATQGDARGNGYVFRVSGWPGVREAGGVATASLTHPRLWIKCGIGHAVSTHSLDGCDTPGAPGIRPCLATSQADGLRHGSRPSPVPNRQIVRQINLMPSLAPRCMLHQEAARRSP
jgi:hypothetical protein